MQLLGSIKDEVEYYSKRILKQRRLNTLRQRDDEISYKQFDENKCIFIHVPKNAGISIVKSLLGKRVGHFTALQYRTIFGKYAFNSYFKFAFVRNPFTRIVSAYEFMCKGGYGPIDKPVVDIIKKYTSFSDFVLNYLNPDSAKKIRHFRPQHYFICDSNDKILVDFFGRYETIEQDYETIRKRLGKGYDLKKLNTTHTNQIRDYKDFYKNEKVLEQVKDIYKKDFLLFDYNTDISFINL